MKTIYYHKENNIQKQNRGEREKVIKVVRILDVLNLKLRVYPYAFIGLQLCI